MQRLARVNGTQAFLGALALVVTGAFAPGAYGAVVLFALVAGLLVLLPRGAALRRHAHWPGQRERAYPP